ncbi:hypothetical protein VHEMI08086 [[Torrubiella] hemipterigena]|uniref:Uncharacterized protein n=1 Tax=[Torrubiella] hemipterigena TaxID=1531966 RepID=A0A0A1TP26_9HYPO|nr:hypothetical protein VHEMI08086 [[Torrubiella] hemipterigena]
MASYYQYNTQPPPVSHNHHGGRNRRAGRLSVSQNAQRQFRGVRSMKELNETAALSAFRTKFEAIRSFDIEDDLEFCPGLLTENDLVSMSSASERSSLASNSPDSSPTQQPNSVVSGFSLSSNSPPFVPPSLSQQSMKLHQPAATRGRNAIPIINPLTGISMASPPPSVSPARMQPMGRRW